jgi:hypothetical protein
MRVAALVLCIMVGVAGLGLIGGACATEGQVEPTPKSITQSEQAKEIVEVEKQVVVEKEVVKIVEVPGETVTVVKEEELLQDITWTTVADEERIFSISVPSEWETNIDTEALSAEQPVFAESGLVLFLSSVDVKTGSNLLIFMDVQHMFAEEPIDVEAYIQLQIESAKQMPGSSGISTHAVAIDGIKGTQIRYTLKSDASGNGYLMQTNILIGNEDETRMLCGYIAMFVQSLSGSDAQLSVLEEAIESLRILPTAAGELESCN